MRSSAFIKTLLVAAIAAASAAQAAGPTPGPVSAHSTLQQAHRVDVDGRGAHDDERTVLAEAKVPGGQLGIETAAAPNPGPALQATASTESDADLGAPGSKAFALLAGLAMMLALARRRRRDSF
jgi:MYXO-CTERM domain-containing protein